MTILRGTFAVPLDSISLRFIGESDTSTRAVAMSIENFKVRATLESRNSAKIGHEGSSAKRFFFDYVTAEIEREYPPAECDQVFTELGAYMTARREYQQVLIEALNRIVSYFKFKLRNPALTFVGPYHLFRNKSAFFHPAWSRDGVAVKDPLGEVQSSVGEIPGGLFLFGEFGFGIAGLTDDRLAEFEACLQHPAVPDLYDELLSEAQSAAVFGNVRRAVLELAIAAEVFIKNAFFARESVAGAAIDYLEGAGGRSLKATELLSGAAKNAFGVSFKEVNRTDFENIDFLFRARNSIAHRGRSRFRKDSGEEIDVDWDLLKTWWSSVSNMHTWLTSQLAGRNP